MEYNITHKDGRWLVDGKRLEDLNHDEIQALDLFFIDYKILHEQYKTNPNGNSTTNI